MSLWSLNKLPRSTYKYALGHFSNKSRHTWFSFKGLLNIRSLGCLASVTRKLPLHVHLSLEDRKSASLDEVRKAKAEGGIGLDDVGVPHEYWIRLSL